MQPFVEPVTQDLVLIGGGHSHSIALRAFGMNPLAGVRVTLISEQSITPYSGMLPGYVAGQYEWEDCHIDLRSLCQFAEAQLYLDQVVGLDLDQQQVICANRPPVHFDLLSLNIGSSPRIPAFFGSEHFESESAADSVVSNIAVKPVGVFLAWWEALCMEVSAHPTRSVTVSLVGGGAGGVELALAMQWRLQRLVRQAWQVTIHLFSRSPRLLPNHAPMARQAIKRHLQKQGISLHLGETVQQLTAEGVVCNSGLMVPCDGVVWVTEAMAPEWLQESGLKLDERGFVRVDRHLRSLSHSQVFAAGDIAAMDRPCAKSGVYAVRQGMPLARNLGNALQGKPLKPYRPQPWHLALIGTGDSAVASFGKLGFAAPWLWKLKQRIDRQFMEGFAILGAATEQMVESQEQQGMPLQCSGCGAKVGGQVLDRVLTRLAGGTVLPEDAAVVAVPQGRCLLQTIDYFPTLVNDPYLFGQIAAQHSLSDLFAMGATPHSALALVTLPYGSAMAQEETLFQLLSGAVQVLGESHTALLGGHTLEGPTLGFGLTCNGSAHPQQILRKGGLHPGDLLILTKPLGSGVLFAAEMRGQAKPHWIDGAIEVMRRSNLWASGCFLAHGATACTDITGFGLIGHLVEMLQASKVGAALYWERLPWLLGAQEITRHQGTTSSLQAQNRSTQSWIDNLEEAQKHPDFPLLFDPQTSGGLLASVPFDRAEACLKALQDQGNPESAIIGRVVAASEGVTGLRMERCQIS
ncbi:MAG: selenide, water dikinase SelD [Alkalinema sp. RU_4_3]|nr:selenide, water dikinase SelD [Alkalinema sp. RU_4_3]